MNLVRLQQRGIGGDLFHEKFDQCRVVLGGQSGVDRREFIGVCLAVVRWHEHACQNNFGTGRLAEFDHAGQVAANHGDRRTAQPVIAAELDQYDVRCMDLQCARQPAQSAARRIAADAGIDHPIIVMLG